MVALATTDRHSPMQIALNEVARRAVMADPAWCGGRTARRAGPDAGLAVARMLGHVTYLSEARMERKFGRRAAGDTAASRSAKRISRSSGTSHTRARSFVRRFDANALLYLTKALDYFDMSERHRSLEEAAAATRARFLLLSFSSDWLYPPAQLERLAAALRAAGRDVEHRCLASTDGHDAFLLEHEQQSPLIQRFLARTENPGAAQARPATSP